MSFKEFNTHWLALFAPGCLDAIIALHNIRSSFLFFTGFDERAFNKSSEVMPGLQDEEGWWMINKKGDQH